MASSPVLFGIPAVAAIHVTTKEPLIMRVFTRSFFIVAALAAPFAQCMVASAMEISAVPGPDDQGGMKMPLVTIQASAGTGENPTAGAIAIGFTPGSTPVLQSLEAWSPGDWFADTANWRPDIGSPAGVGGTPLANAGNGDLFNNQYGFMFMSMGMPMMANVPTGKSLGIKLTGISSASLTSFNYGNAANRWDEVFPSVGSQVLWNGTMWHNYFTLPASASAGTYTAEFQIFIANTEFTGTTGFAQYDAAAAAALADPLFTPASVTYTWTVAPVPEPSTIVIVSAASLAVIPVLRRRRTGAAT